MLNVKLMVEVNLFFQHSYFFSITQSLAHSLTHSLTHSPNHPITLLFIHFPNQQRGFVFKIVGHLCGIEYQVPDFPFDVVFGFCR